MSSDAGVQLAQHALNTAGNRDSDELGTACLEHCDLSQCLSTDLKYLVQLST